MYIIESNFKYKGYQCIGIFGDMGHRCGYVGVPEGHPLYGKDFGSQLKVAMKEMQNEPIGKRSPIQLFYFSDKDLDDQIEIQHYFNIHGGITYLGGGKESTYPIESDLWWLGFDCGHAGDGKDLDLVEHLWGDDERVKRRLEIERFYYIDDEIRTREYVVEECKSLVDQIKRYVTVWG